MLEISVLYVFVPCSFTVCAFAEGARKEKLVSASTVTVQSCLLISVAWIFELQLQSYPHLLLPALLAALLG